MNKWKFPMMADDFVMGWTVFTGSILRYGRIDRVEVQTKKKKKNDPAHLCLVNVPVEKEKGMLMTLRACVFSSRSIL